MTRLHPGGHRSLVLLGERIHKVYEVYWLNVLGPELVESVGRECMLSTPAWRVEELPGGSALVVLRPTAADFASEAARNAQARALVHLRPDLNEARAVPAVGAYLGEVLVRRLGGKWIPRNKLVEAQVQVGQRVWYPFLRAQRYMGSRQSLLDYSLTQLYREAERHRG